MNKTSIGWCHYTWNPVTGCTEVSPGCANCYAKTWAERFRGTPAFPHGFDLVLHPERLEQPLAVRQPSLVFVNSMSDLFHEAVPDDYIERVFDVMIRAHRHTYQVLTKRPERMAAWFEERGGAALWTDRNVWLGVSVENAAFRHRIDTLRSIPAMTRFLSCEPLLGDLGRVELDGIHWVIVGGESGPTRYGRRMQPAWARSIRDQCAAAGVAFYFKQWGVYNADGLRLGKSGSGRFLDGRRHDEIPPFASATQA